METTIPEAKLTEKAKNVIGSLVAWSHEDFKKTNQQTFQTRLMFCRACDYWKPDAFLGTGKCGICGCSVGKLYIPASKCPHPEPRWLGITYKYTFH